jgi:hypothetical protein
VKGGRGGGFASVDAIILFISEDEYPFFIYMEQSFVYTRSEAELGRWASSGFWVTNFIRQSFSLILTLYGQSHCVADCASITQGDFHLQGLELSCQRLKMARSYIKSSYSTISSAMGIH